MSVKYPNITVKDFGRDGNAFVLLGQVVRAMRDAGCTQEQITEFREEATSGDYSNLLATCGKYVNLQMTYLNDEDEDEFEDEEEDYD